MKIQADFKAVIDRDNKSTEKSPQSPRSGNKPDPDSVSVTLLPILPMDSTRHTPLLPYGDTFLLSSAILLAPAAGLGDPAIPLF